MFHEFGHHVHQVLGKTGRRTRAGTPMEIELERMFNQVDQDRMFSTYGVHNHKEWFAENFAAFVTGRRELLEPEILDLIERVFDGKYP